MPSRILPASFDAGAVASTAIEAAVPTGWPGTYCPNFSDWHVGDIVLVHAAAGWMGRMLRAGQGLSFRRDSRVGRHVTHAAIHVGAGTVLDATFGRRIAERSVWQYCQSRQIEVRRVPDLSPDDRTAIADASGSHVGEPYSTLSLVLSKLVPGTVSRRGALYCSTFVGLVFAEAVGIDLERRAEHRPLYPSTLATHSALRVVPLEWRGL